MIAPYLETTAPSKKHGITEKKKAELDRLANQVLTARHRVEELQAIVNSLTQKALDFSAALTSAAGNRASALNNNTLLTQIIQSAKSLFLNSEKAYEKLDESDKKIQELAGQVNDLIEKLIFAAEVVNKLANEVVRQKALNPLISDELVSMVATAGTEANNAVALTLLALKSTFASQATCLESEANSNLMVVSSGNLYTSLIGEPNSVKPVPLVVAGMDPLQKLISDALQAADDQYNSALKNNTEIDAELNNAVANLNVAQINLASFESGLAAANAAAFAS